MEKVPKRVHFIRHGESLYNCFRRELRWSERALKDKPVAIDPALTHEGIQQTIRLKDYLIETLKPEVAVSSPYTRALQTCLLSYGSANVEITALCGEIFQTDGTDDIGLPASCLKAAYPMFNFSSLNELWWYTQEGITTQLEVVNYFTEGKLTEEPMELVALRAEKFLHYLQNIPQNNIAVFSHCDFLVFLLSKYFEFDDLHLDNCEVFTVDLNTACDS